MIDTQLKIQTKTFPIDQDLKLAIARFNPGEIHSIGINPEQDELVINCIPGDIIEQAGRGNLDIRFRFPRHIIFLRGLVKAEGYILTGFDSGFFAEREDLAVAVIEALSEAFSQDLKDLYLATPDREFDFFAIQGSIWRLIQAQTITCFGNAILASFNGRLKTLAANAIKDLFATGQTEWIDVEGISDDIAFLGGGATRPILATTINGKVTSFQLRPIGNRFKATEINQIDAKANQVFGPIFGMPNFAAAIIDRNPEEAAVAFIPAAAFANII